MCAAVSNAGKRFHLSLAKIWKHEVLSQLANTMMRNHMVNIDTFAANWPLDEEFASTQMVH